MANGYNDDNVSFGSPKVTGVFYTAPYGTKLPTDATTALDAAFISNGRVGEKGITNAIKTDSSEIKDMSGSTVLTQITGYSETYKMVLIEFMSAQAAKTAYGDDAVTVDATAKSFAVTHAMPSGTFSAVVELALNGGGFDRVVIPKVTRSELGERSMVGTEAMGYDVTLAANAYAGFTTTGGRVGTSREYIALPATSTGA
ncbi:MAG: hypothetical protein LKI88_00825 [Bifidobacterium sp.]|jgi:hypothetical protein|nr:hypothetical protein [Bifidobacterium sp.]MCI1864473.1 hypothetical protein [Bifidobacterium sp.]